MHMNRFFPPFFTSCKEVRVWTVWIDNHKLNGNLMPGVIISVNTCMHAFEVYIFGMLNAYSAEMEYTFYKYMHIDLIHFISKVIRNDLKMVLKGFTRRFFFYRIAYVRTGVALAVSCLLKPHRISWKILRPVKSLTYIR